MTREERKTLEEIYKLLRESWGREIQNDMVVEAQDKLYVFLNEAPQKELSSAQIAEFLDDIADTVAGYLLNKRDDADARKYGTHLDAITERLKEWRE